MRGFLEEVAADLYARYGERLSERAVLFPSRRARLFFTEALSRIASRPMWQPAWSTIDDLMTEISGLRTAERVRLITELYKVYSEFHTEPFDKFYFWGDMLLTDFDTIDKYLIDARQLFRNITDIKEIEADISYLTPRQIEIIRTFWSTLGAEADLSQEKQRFLAIWRTLGPIYERYRERLTQLGIAYNGMVQRAAVERIREGLFSFPEERHYVVAGFNALTECEKRLFRFLSTAAHTDFYWDYDSYYKDHPEQEAGMFVRTNVAEFPPAGPVSHDNMARAKRFTAVSTLSNAVQCKYAAKILGELLAERRRATGDPDARLGKEVAVVLTDENLLLPLLYALPGELGPVNVTMGFLLKASLAYTFVERLVELQAHGRRRGEGWGFYHVDVEGLLAHPYLADCDAALTRHLHEQILSDRRITVDAAWLTGHELLDAVFRPTGEWRDLSAYLQEVIAAVARQPYAGDDANRRVEFLAVIAEELARLHNSLEGCAIDLTSEVYASLLRRHLQTLRIPFEGEPLEGIQIMGILETRNLDFEHVILLSMADDNFPGNLTGASSFVPYNLRAAFALPTPEHHEGVYAYYFYRLVQRASTVHMLYCSHADDKSTGEPSRYIYQLDYESGFPIEKVEVGVDVNLASPEPIVVPKGEREMARLAEFLEGAESPATLSPTALSRYVACPLRFYFHSVARLESDDEVSEEVDAPMFGTILHEAAQTLYKPFEGGVVAGEALRALCRTDAVERAVERAINENFLRDTDAQSAGYTGNLLLVKDIVMRYLSGGVLAYDAVHDGFTLRGLESPVAQLFAFRVGDRTARVKFAGRADRIDRLAGGTLRVVDYKTGSPHLEFDGVEALFRGEARQRQANVLQTLLYAMMLHRTEGADVEPALYYVRQLNRPDYTPSLVDTERGVSGCRYAACAERFESLLGETLSELYNPEIPFRQCDDAAACAFCDFNVICKRA